MKYALLIYPGRAPQEVERLSAAEQRSILGEYMALPRRLRSRRGGRAGGVRIAAERWPQTAAPENLGAWLTTTGRNRAIDRIRRDRTLAAKTQLLRVPEAVDDEVSEMEEQTFPDERLELIFTCCHPALALEGQVALTLRTLGGLTTDEIARAFLVPVATMKRRLTRAKYKIGTAGHLEVAG